MQGFDIPSNLYSSDISMIPLPTELQNILLPPHYFAVLFWIAFGLWILSIIGILISSVYVVEKHNTKVRASVMAQLALPSGMSDLYILIQGRLSDH